jgi:polar amino acid transport system substrate-binding protein
MQGLLSRVAGCAILGAFACAPALAKDTITLCFERQEVLPWRTLNGGGLNFELLNQVATKLDITFDYQSMPWKRCLEQLKANEVGGAFAVSFNVGRMAIGEYPGGATPDFGKRMHIDRYVLMRKKGAKIDWDGKKLSNVNGAIGFQLGYSVGDFLRGMRVPVDEGSQRASELAQKLIAGRLAGAALGGGDAVSLMNGPLAPQLEVLPLPLIEKPYFLILSHALVASNPQLAERIWKAVEEARNSPAYRKLARDAEGGRH